MWADRAGHYDRPVRELTDEEVAQYEESGLIRPFPLVDDKARAELIRGSRPDGVITACEEAIRDVILRAKGRIHA